MKTLLALSLIFLIRDYGQYAQNSPELKEWFNGLTSKQGNNCCSMADGRRIDDADWDIDDKGNYKVQIDGTWYEVPDNAVVRSRNRVGYAVVWPAMMTDQTGKQITYIRCFMAGTQI